MAGKGDTVVVSRRFIQGRALFAAGATSLAAVGMILTAATALADDSASGDSDAPKCVTPLSDGTCPTPGREVIRSVDRGTANAGPSAVTAPARGEVSTTGGLDGGPSKGAPVLNSDGNPVKLCFANAEFDAATCGLGS
jgi:hypothetical protein